MPRKRIYAGLVGTNKPFMLYLPPEKHARLKKIAKYNGSSMQGLIMMAIDFFFENGVKHAG